MAAQKKSLFSLKGVFVRFFGAHSDVAFIVVTFCIIGYAAFVFYRFLYPPLFMPLQPHSQEPAFNSTEYQSVMDRIEKRQEALAEQIRLMQRNPF